MIAALAALAAATLFWLFAIVWITEIGRGAHPFGWFKAIWRRLALWIGEDW